MQTLFGSCKIHLSETWMIKSLILFSPQIGELIYVAGQIALCPASMQLISGGPHSEARLSLRHVDRVLRAVDASCFGLASVVLAVCYVTDASYIPAVEQEWKRAVSG